MLWRYNPGSAEAISEGCTCPADGNNDGNGIVFMGITKRFWVHEDCPLHAKKTEKGDGV
jgi:hypothetical protein